MKIGVYKEIIISIVVIIFVVVLNIITESYTKQSVETMTSSLNQLKDIMKNDSENSDKIKDKINDIKEDWESKYQKLAYYIEHDELEKVNTELTALKSNIDEEEYKQGLPELEKCIFILNHIKEKSSMQIKNVF